MLHNHHLEGDSFVWEGGPVGVVLSHGYTATTTEVRPVARLLHEQGYSVAGPLLPGHGTTPNEMARTSWQTWAAALTNSYRQLAHRCDHVFIGGESMGGALAFYVASQLPEAAGALLYSPAMQIPRRPLALSYLARPFIRHAKKKNPHRLHPEWKGYLVNPLASLHQLHRLQRKLWPLASRFRQPLLIVQGRHDTDIDLRGVEKLYQVVESEVKEFHWMENSGHVVLLDDEREQVAQITRRFMERVVQRHRATPPQTEAI